MRADCESILTTAELAELIPSRERLLPVLRLLYPENRRAPLSKAELTVGRSRSQDLPLPGQAVSRLHCRFLVKDDCVTLGDAGSRNGTYVNGRMADDSELCIGDVVRIGDWVGIFTREAEDASGAIQELEPNLLAGAGSRPTLQQALRAASTALPILLNGESGSGKECFARFIHHHSQRRGRFVAVNCAAIPESLAEGELFGHCKGAYTGADRSRPGAFQRAHGGTLLLDEVSDLPLAVQAKLLRVLEEGQVMPLGATDPVAIDVRIIAAGQEPLSTLVHAKRFRGDLFARLDGVALTIPPLRARKDEILPLFERAYREQTKKAAPALRPEFAEALLLYTWPFNVRELQHTAQRLAVLHEGLAELTAQQVPREWQDELPRQGAIAPPPGCSPARQLPELHLPDERHAARSSRWQQQLDALRQALHQHHGNLSRAAENLGISRARAYRLIKAARELEGSQRS